jgi:hypothetical protein
MGIMAHSSMTDAERLAVHKPRRLLSGALCVAALLFATAGAQTDSPQVPLGDLARKTRAESGSKNHARRVLNDDNAPRAHWIKRTSDYWATIPPAILTISIPESSHGADFGVEVPIGKSSVYIPFGETVWSTSFDTAAQEYLSMLLNRSRFRGAALTLDGVEDTTVSGQEAKLVHFNFDFKGIHHAGVALFVSAPAQVVGVGCMYRSADWEQADPICEEVINSAEVKVPTEYKLFKKPF